MFLLSPSHSSTHCCCSRPMVGARGNQGMLLHFSRNAENPWRGWRPQSTEGAESDGGMPTLKTLTGGITPVLCHMGIRELPVPCASVSQTWHETGEGSYKHQQQPSAVGNTPSAAQPSPAASPAWQLSAPRRPRSLAAVPSLVLCQGRQYQPCWAVPASSQTLSPCSAPAWGWGWGGMECPGTPAVLPSSLTACQDCCWTPLQGKPRVLPCPGV